MASSSFCLSVVATSRDFSSAELVGETPVPVAPILSAVRSGRRDFSADAAGVDVLAGREEGMGVTVVAKPEGRDGAACVGCSMGEARAAERSVLFPLAFGAGLD